MIARRLVLGVCGASSVALTAMVALVPARSASAPAACLPSAAPVLVLPDPALAPALLEPVVSADYYVDRLRDLRQACKAWGGRDFQPMAVEQGVFVECWSPVPEERLWARWVTFGGKVSEVAPPERKP